MIGHNGSLPHRYLWIKVMNLGQLHFKDSMSQRTKNNMRKAFRTTACMYVTFDMSEQRMSPFYAEGNHIQTTAAIVLPVSTSVLVVLNIMRFQSST